MTLSLTSIASRMHKKTGTWSEPSRLPRHQVRALLNGPWDQRGTQEEGVWFAGLALRLAIDFP